MMIELVKNNKRKICKRCDYPLTTCVCQWVKLIESPVQIIVLQHPKEQKHAKNSVKLLKLGLSKVTVIVGESAQDFTDLIEMIKSHPQQTCVFYPSDKSGVFESKSIMELNKFRNLIFIDSSWRKALKMWHLNPWLHALPSFHFDNPPANQYHIRKTSQENSLSTLESVAYVLEHTHKLDCTSLKTLFINMQNKQFSHPSTNSIKNSD